MPLKLRSSTSRLGKEPGGQSIRLVTQLPGSSSVCRIGRWVSGAKEASLLPLKSKCLCSMAELIVRSQMISKIECEKLDQVVTSVGSIT